MTYRIAFSIALLVSCWPGDARAESQASEKQDVDQIIVYGRAAAEVGIATSGSEGVVGYADFENRPISRVGELAENVPGLIATQHSGSGKANQYFLRGFNLDHGTDLAGYVDGAPINMRSHGHGQGYLDLNFLIPETVERIDYTKGPYHAADGDFASSGTMRYTLKSRLARPLAEVTAGSFSYVRGLLAGSTPLGSGTVLGAIETTLSDGPWVLPERGRKVNALFKFSAAEWSLGLSGYLNRWTSTDQVPERAIRTGLIPRLGFIDPFLGGRSGRVALTFNGRFGETTVAAYAIASRLQLTSNFTYFLDDPANGDEFRQVDRRGVFGGSIGHEWTSGRITWRVGADARWDRIGKVGLYRTAAGTVTGTERQDRVDEYGGGAFAEAEATLAPGLRLVVGLRGDAIGYRVASDLSANSGRGSAAIVTPKLALAWQAARGLSMLELAGVLSAEGAEELASIKEKRDYLDRATEDRDFFSSYTSGVQRVVGDAGPIEEAQPDDRLQIAVELARSPDIDRQLGWRSYCRSDPQGAFATLDAAELTEPNIGLWGELIAALSFSDESDKPLRHALLVKAFARLEALPEIPLKALGISVVDALMTGPRREIANLDAWLAKAAQSVMGEDQELNLEKELYGTAINSAAGRIAQVQLQEIDYIRKEEAGDLAGNIQRLRDLASNNGAAGTLARAICVHDLAFLLAVDPALVDECLVSRIAADDAEGRALRRILVMYSAITPEVTKMIPQAIITAVVESQPDHHAGSAVASRILRPALASVRGDDAERWGLTEADVSRALRLAPPNVRRGVLDVLVRWLHNDEAGVEEAWDKMVAPFFDRVWPKERRFVDEANNQHLISIAVGAGGRFPAALVALRPYIVPYERERAHLVAVKQSHAPENFPNELLELLWRAFGRAGATSYDMPEVLDRLVKALPSLEVDRRLQSLEQRTVRFR